MVTYMGKLTKLLPQGVPSRTIPKSGRSVAATDPLVILYYIKRFRKEEFKKERKGAC